MLYYSSQISLEELLDLDMALTMPDSTTSLNNEDPEAEMAAAARASNLVGEMPTVAMSGAGECIVCLDEFPIGGRVKQVPCGHVFHENCISRWLSVNNSCPLCRGKVSNNQRLLCHE